MVEFGAAISALRGAYETVKTVKEINDRAALNAAVSDVVDRLKTAQFTLTELLQQHHELIDENRSLRQQLQREERFDRYRLEETPLGGTFCA